MSGEQINSRSLWRTEKCQNVVLDCIVSLSHVFCFYCCTSCLHTHTHILREYVCLQCLRSLVWNYSLLNHTSCNFSVCLDCVRNENQTYSVEKYWAQNRNKTKSFRNQIGKFGVVDYWHCENKNQNLAVLRKKKTKISVRIAYLRFGFSVCFFSPFHCDEIDTFVFYQ